MTDTERQDIMQPDKPDTSIMTAQEVADLFRVHRSTITRLALDGKIRSYIIGRRRLFKTGDVWSFFENQVAREFISGKDA